MSHDCRQYPGTYDGRLVCEKCGRTIERRVLRVAVAYTVEVDLDAHEAEYGPATRSEVREHLQSSARAAFDAGAAFSTDDIARVI